MARKSSGFEGMNFTEVAIQQAYKMATEPIYCRYCGANILTPTSMSTKYHDNRWYNDWEIENNAHEKCYNRQFQQQRRRY